MEQLGTTTDFEQMQAVDVRAIDKNSLVDLNCVKIDESMPVEQRMIDFLRQIKNPYCFLVGDVVVKVVYKKNGPSFQQNMVDMLRTV